MVNIGFAFCFREARLSTIIGGDFEINNFFEQLSTITRLISNKDGDLLSHFHNINETIYQFSRGLQTYHLNLEIHFIRKFK